MIPGLREGERWGRYRGQPSALMRYVEAEMARSVPEMTDEALIADARRIAVAYATATGCHLHIMIELCNRLEARQ